MSKGQNTWFFPLPVHLLLAIVTTFIMFVWLGWHVIFTHKEFETLRTSVIQIQNNHAEILDLHQQLINFVRLASTTGWPWPQKEYEKTKKELEALLTSRVSGVQPSHFYRLSSHQELRKIEQRAFILIEDQHLQSAVTLLFSDRYNQLVDAFKEDTTQHFSEAQKRFLQRFSYLEKQDYISLATAVVIFLISIFIWLYLYKNLFEWQKRVKKEVRQRKSIEEELFQAQKMEVIGQLSAGISHDFNNLLAVMHGYAELAESKISDNVEASRLIKCIRQAASQANDVTRALLTLSRTTPSEKHPLELAPVLQETTQLLKELLPASITLIQDNREKKPVWIMANRGQIQQAVLNLALNARDAMPTGGRITISLWTKISASQGAAGQHVYISVSDTGTGIDAETLNKIREPYFTTKPRTQGTGLGLAIVDGIIDAHKGHLSIKSAVGSGSTFIIELDTINPVDFASANSDSTTPKTEISGLILILQDHEYTQKILISALKKAGYFTTTVDPGNIQINSDTFANQPFDLLILDYETFGKKTLTILQNLRDEGNTKPVILVTAEPIEESLNQLDPWTLTIEKPFQVSQVTALIRRLLLI